MRYLNLKSLLFLFAVLLFPIVGYAENNKELLVTIDNALENIEVGPFAMPADKLSEELLRGMARNGMTEIECLADSSSNVIAFWPRWDVNPCLLLYSRSGFQYEIISSVELQEVVGASLSFVQIDSVSWPSGEKSQVVFVGFEHMGSSAVKSVATFVREKNQYKLVGHHFGQFVGIQRREEDLILSVASYVDRVFSRLKASSNACCSIKQVSEYRITETNPILWRTFFEDNEIFAIARVIQGWTNMYGHPISINLGLAERLKTKGDICIGRLHDGTFQLKNSNAVINVTVEFDNGFWHVEELK